MSGSMFFFLKFLQVSKGFCFRRKGRFVDEIFSDHVKEVFLLGERKECYIQSKWWWIWVWRCPLPKWKLSWNDSDIYISYHSSPRFVVTWHAIINQNYTYFMWPWKVVSSGLTFRKYGCDRNDLATVCSRTEIGFEPNVESKAQLVSSTKMRNMLSHEPNEYSVFLSPIRRKGFGWIAGTGWSFSYEFFNGLPPRFFWIPNVNVISTPRYWNRFLFRWWFQVFPWGDDPIWLYNIFQMDSFPSYFFIMKGCIYERCSFSEN